MRRHDVRQYYLEHGEELQRYLTRRLGCADTAADLTQEAFARLLKSQSAEYLENPRAYLYRVVGNLVADHFRGTARAPRAVQADLWHAIPDENPDPERAALSRADVARLEEVIAAMPRRQRDVLLLHKFEGLSYAEIAQRLGISKNTVMVHMMRALARCRDGLSDP